MSTPTWQVKHAAAVQPTPKHTSTASAVSACTVGSAASALPRRVRPLGLTLVVNPCLLAARPRGVGWHSVAGCARAPRRGSPQGLTP